MFSTSSFCYSIVTYTFVVFLCFIRLFLLLLLLFACSDSAAFIFISFIQFQVIHLAIKYIRNKIKSKSTQTQCYLCILRVFSVAVFGILSYYFWIFIVICLSIHVFHLFFLVFLSHLLILVDTRSTHYFNLKVDKHIYQKWKLPKKSLLCLTRVQNQFRITFFLLLFFIFWQSHSQRMKTTWQQRNSDIFKLFFFDLANVFLDYCFIALKLHDFWKNEPIRHTFLFTKPFLFRSFNKWIQHDISTTHYLSFYCYLFVSILTFSAENPQQLHIYINRRE